MVRPFSTLKSNPTLLLLTPILSTVSSPTPSLTAGDARQLAQSQSVSRSLISRLADEEERGGWLPALSDRPREDSSHLFSRSNALRSRPCKPSSPRRRDRDECLDLDALHFSLADISSISSRSVLLHRNLAMLLARPVSFSWRESVP